MDRQLVRSSHCTVHIPEFELTLPEARGQLTTVEGLVRDIVADLSTDQPVRLALQDPAYPKIQSIIDGLNTILDAEADKMPPFTMQLDDPSGDSFVEFIGTMADPKWNLRTYKRTRAQNVELGLISADAAPDALEAPVLPTVEPGESEALEDKNAEIFAFPGICSSCGHDLTTYMKKVDIPYFKDIIIMSTNCTLCGYRDNEVKSGSAISAQGKRITLKVEDREDLSRDILKSETSGLSIPEIDLVLQPGTLGGRFTTLEGILEQVYEELTEKVFNTGDAASTDAADRVTFTKFLADLKAVKSAERPFTLIVDDPLANSYVQNIYAPDPDPNMTIEMYDRTFDQDEELGLNDIKVEGYEADADAGVKIPEGATKVAAAKETPKLDEPASTIA